jgi:hypothetical protein
MRTKSHITVASSSNDIVIDKPTIESFAIIMDIMIIVNVSFVGSSLTMIDEE